jgi:hypothetical protein
MPDVMEPLDTDQAATEIAVTMAVLLDLSPDTPLARWIEYRAYQELVALVREARELPDSYVVFTPDAASLRDWLVSGKHLRRRFSEEMVRLITQLQAAGGGVIDNLCRLYCELKNEGALTMDAATLLLSVSGIATAILASGGGFLFIGGLPLTAVVAFLLHAGVLDKACDCGLHTEDA